MTEDEAKTKACCGPWAVNWSGRVFNTEASGRAQTCIGSACMAWRWSEAKRSLAFLEAVQGRMREQSKPNFNTATQEVYAQRGGEFEHSEGYCGLAGALP